MRSQFAFLTHTTTQSNSVTKVVTVSESATQAGLHLDQLPANFSEEEFDEFLVEHGVFDKLLSQLDQTLRSTDWEAELDEL